ncbi:endonuclease III [Finegoldia magna]|uniref:Endonuclease III n=2 Tax=Finegoldia magna TaxID=1260 RepID=B0S197_FINM2|nr:endonuclease III [Finegoldia magna]EFK93536.1 endonuclease III [Finegoldia magna ACS-171-V-Col3]EGS33810.1 endonuclease III [Finegoldia magna SY403409CC001050417]EXF26940.1 endonuclease III [Finegoldia magna ALB8]KXA08903.1 endonuclease III [Finegoldia magna]MDU1212924.1 endonuclease III [Finegoldia magna]
MSYDKINKILDDLDSLYPDAKAGLDFTTPFELLIATILSAQCTDVRVNKVTAVLFKEHNTPKSILDLGIDGLTKYIKSCGLYKTKSKNIINTCNVLYHDYDSKVPDNIEELMKLPGVGRKTANVVVSNAFDTPAIAVDTHVFRVTNRIGIVNEKDVLSTEKALMRVIPKERWSKSHHLFIWHGRNICKARNPKCEECILNDRCKFYNS